MQDFDYQTETKIVTGTFEVPHNVAHLMAPQQDETAIVIRVRAENNKPVIDIDSTLSIGDTHDQLVDILLLLEAQSKGTDT